MIHVVATLTVQEGRRDEYLAIFGKYVPIVQAEDGCIRYEPFVDIDSGLERQKPLRENVVVVLETWESLEKLHAHIAAPHMAELKAELGDIVTDLDLQIVG